MTGSGNDFVMVGGRISTPDDWTPADVQAACARGTGVGADGLVFVTPGSHPGAVRMIYFNSDGSRAAMCGNAALCSTTLAAHLSLGAADGMDLETDAGTSRPRQRSRGSAWPLGSSGRPSGKSEYRTSSSCWTTWTSST